MILNTKHLLFCPGPVNIAQNVKEAATNSEIGHREAEFSVLLGSLNSKLLRVFEIKNKKAYHPIFITGSGTAANESVLSSVVDKKRVLIITNGEFGERLVDISKIYNKHTHHLKFNWGEKIDLSKVEKIIKKSEIEMIALVHHETSTGMLNPIEELGKLAKKYKLLFFLDTVSSAGAEKIDIEKWNVSFCTTSSGKALGSFPGLGIVIGKKVEFEKLKDIKPRTTYLNLYKFYQYSKNLLQTPNTPGIQLFFALEQALSNILAIGVRTKRKHIYQTNQILRIGVRKLGFTFLMDEKDMSSVLTTVNMPSDIDVNLLKKKLRDRNIIVYNGKGPLLNKVFQVGSIGTLDKKSIRFFLISLKEILDLFRSDRIHKYPTLSRQPITMTRMIPNFSVHQIHRKQILQAVKH